ncbi:hypothetical protein BP6252_08529 [Coleophoma cylindrospora]|uniref:Histone H4 n=1 Tax=Coleophoma cylindrospora TaxID=1849047 RepID=A0A3D8R636_9HELO|nr:hypothetical protein BP6252_08529 [Coleophoma cylindrospora]
MSPLLSSASSRRVMSSGASGSARAATAGPSRPAAGLFGHPRPTLGGKGIAGQAGQFGSGRGKGSRGIGAGVAKAFKRQRKLLKDNIQGITKSDIRRMARRGGVKRISADVYDEMRTAMKKYLERILRDCVAIVDGMHRHIRPSTAGSTNLWVRQRYVLRQEKDHGVKTY